MDIIPYLISKLDEKDNINALETGTIRSYYEKHESTRWLGESIKGGKIISIDIEPKSIEISKDICKNLNNIEWILGDSLEVMSRFDESSFDFILLDSVNDSNHIYKEFIIALKLIKKGGTIMIDDFGVNYDGNIPDSSQPEAVKGVKVFQVLKDNGLLSNISLNRSTKGVQGIFMNIKQELKDFDFSKF